MTHFLGLDSSGKLVLFVTYILLWSAQGIFVHNATKQGPLNSASIVLLQEILKMGISVTLFTCNEKKSFNDLAHQIFLHRHLALLYIVPALLYSVYNNLTFTGLRFFDPASYFVLMQFRIVLTAAMSVLLLRKRFTPQQWLALTIVMIGAMFKEIPNLWSSSSTHNGGGIFMRYSVIVVQLGMSTLAGVFNEKLLKSDASPNVQNLFMYFHSVWINGLFGIYSSHDWSVVLNANIWPVIINAACLGVLTGFFLKHLSSVLKSIASAIELWVTAVASALVFGYSIDLVTVGGIIIVSAGIYMYSIASSASAPCTQRIGSLDGVEMGHQNPK